MNVHRLPVGTQGDIVVHAPDFASPIISITPEGTIPVSCRRPRGRAAHRFGRVCSNSNTHDGVVSNHCLIRRAVRRKYTAPSP